MGRFSNWLDGMMRRAGLRRRYFRYRLRRRECDPEMLRVLLEKPSPQKRILSHDGLMTIILGDGRSFVQVDVPSEYVCDLAKGECGPGEWDAAESELKRAVEKHHSGEEVLFSIVTDGVQPHELGFVCMAFPDRDILRELLASKVGA